MNDPTRAKALYYQAIERDPLDSDATEQLELLLESHGEYEELAQFLDQHIRLLDAEQAEPTYVAALCYRLAEVWNKQFGETQHALAWYQRAYTLDPNCVAAIYEVRQLYVAASDVAGAADMLEMEIGAEPDVNRRVSLLSELARTKAADLGDINGAILALRSALSALPGDIQVMHELATYLVERAGSADETAAAVDLKRAAELFYRIAEAVADDERLTYLETALQYAPYHEGALDMLEETADRLGRSDVLPAAWVAFVAHAPQSPAVDERRLKLGQAYAAAEQFDDAIYCIEEVAERGEPRAVAMLQELQRRAGRPSALRAAAAAPGSQPERDEEPDFAAALTQEDDDAEPLDEDDDGAPPTVRPPKRRNDAADTPEPVQERARGRAAAGSVLESEPPPAAPPSRITQLKAQLAQLSRSGRDMDAEGVCQEILRLDPSDADAFTFLEGFYRKKRRHEQLRDLLLLSTQTGGLSTEARKLRLREVAGISETKLRDADGAIAAWRSLLTLDPADADAGKNQKRLLEKAKQWDELVQVIEREALIATDANTKADLIEQIALLHRDKRKDVAEALDAFRQLRALRPTDKAVRDATCDLAVAAESYEDAAPLLRERANEADKDRDKIVLLRQLLTILDEKLGDNEGTYEVCEQLLALQPKDLALLDRMQRVDEQEENHERLLLVLERRVQLVAPGERADLYTRMAAVADRALSDTDRAVKYLQHALEVAPDAAEAVEALIDLLDRSERHTELAAVLIKRATATREPAAATDLWRRVARLQAQELGETDAAATSWQHVLEHVEDEEALHSLHERAVTRGDHADVAMYLRRLAYLASDATEKLDLLFERAQLLNDKMGDAAEAIGALRQILDDVDGTHEASLDLLLTIAKQTGNQHAEADALRRRLPLQHDSEERIETATRLANLCEHELQDSDGAVFALQAWTEADAGDPEPFRRLRTLLRSAERYQELLHVLDALAGVEVDEPARNEASIAAAQLAHEHFGDVDGSWDRLMPLVDDGVQEAEQHLHALARKAGREDQLASLYVGRAQDATEPEEQSRHWAEATRIYEEYLDQPSQALEAALRQLACDLDSRDALSQVDRLAVRANAWPRLAQVYDRLLKRADNAAVKVELLRRHADLLDQNANDPSDALDLVMRACALDPADDGLLKRAEDLALRAKRSEELLMVYDRRKTKAESAEAKIDFVLRAARLADDALQDRERALGYLRQALVFTDGAPQTADAIWQTACAFDAARPELGVDDARRALIRAHRDLAEKASKEHGSALILRAATLLREELQDVGGTFDALRQGAALFPTRSDVMEALWAIAHETGRLDALDAHFARLIDDALDSKTTIALLQQRGRLLDGPLNRHADAAEVYAKLLQLDPTDTDAPGKLRACLMRAGRYQDLLIVIDKQSQRVVDDTERLELLKETAHVWEKHLKNRWEALDAWRKVQTFAPDDADATEALARLGADAAPPSIDVDKLLSDEPDTDNVSAESSSRTRVLPDRRSTRPPAPRPSTVPPASAAAAASLVSTENRSAAPTTVTSLPTVPQASDSDDVLVAARAGNTLVDHPAEMPGTAEVQTLPEAHQATTTPAATRTSATVPGLSPAPQTIAALAADDDDNDDEYDDVSDDEVAPDDLGGGLAALDAALASAHDERDFLDDEDVVTPVPNRQQSAPPASNASASAPRSLPPPPPRAGRTASLPPPPPRGARAASLPPPPPPRTSVPPTSAPPPLPPRRR